MVGTIHVNKMYLSNQLRHRLANIICRMTYLSSKQINKWINVNESLACCALCLAQRHLGVLTVIICYSHLWLWGLHQQSGVLKLDCLSFSGWSGGSFSGRPVYPCCAPSALGLHGVCQANTVITPACTHTPHIHIPACLDIGGFNSVWFKRPLFVHGGI